MRDDVDGARIGYRAISRRGVAIDLAVKVAIGLEGDALSSGECTDAANSWSQ